MDELSPTSSARPSTTRTSPSTALGNKPARFSELLDPIVPQDLTSFISRYIDDLVEGMIRMMNTPDVIGPVNLGNPVEFSINDLARHVIRMTGSASKIVYHPLAQDDPERRKPDITLAGRVLNGWAPVVPLEQGLQHTIAYFKSLDFSRYRPPTDMYGPPPTEVGGVVQV